MTLAEVLAAAADMAPDVVVEDTGGASTWSREGRVFAILTGDRAEFRLDRIVTAAALRTPDTEASARGPEWVGFSPPVVGGSVDDHAVDRASSWFAAAWRRAATGH